MVSIKFVEYDPMFREYNVDLSEKTFTRFDFCPWCGVKLPIILVRKWYEYLENEYGIESDDADVDKLTNIPLEFQTDEWWKKRGL